MVGLKLGEKYLIRTRYLNMLLTALYACKEIRPRFLEEGLAQFADSLLELIGRQDLSHSGFAQEGYQNLLNLRDALRLGLRLVFTLPDCENRERQEKSLTGLLPILNERGIRVKCDSGFENVANLMHAKLP
jgi:hypothetical protein